MNAPYLTDAPGIGGTLKRVHEDFVVDEVLQTPPSGTGSWTFLRVRKRGITTHVAASALSRAVRVPLGQVGFAGIKDARAVTTQWFSLPAKSATRLDVSRLRDLEVLEQSAHDEPLRPGRLWGNRFEIRLRRVHPDSEARAGAILPTLQTRGVPHYFGAQRFGVKGDSDAIGRALLREEFDEALRLYLGAPSPLERDRRVHHARTLFEQGQFDEALDAWPRKMAHERKVLTMVLRTNKAIAGLAKLPKSLRLLFISAHQSRLFNRCLAARLPDIDVLRPGDVACVHRDGSEHVVEDAGPWQERAQRFEASPGGPLFGPGLIAATGDTGRAEAQVFADDDLDPDIEDTPFHDVHLKGQRRPYRTPVHDLAWSREDHDLVLRFRLSRGSYATSLLRELQKPNEDVSLI